MVSTTGLFLDFDFDQFPGEKQLGDRFGVIGLPQLQNQMAGIGLRTFEHQHILNPSLFQLDRAPNLAGRKKIVFEERNVFHDPVAGIDQLCF